MVNNTCFIEVNSILNKMNPADLSKIPKDIIEKINKKANDKQVDFEIGKELENQISNEALSILSYIVLKYIANGDQRNQLKKSLVQNQMEYEQRQIPIKNIDEMFKNKEQTKELCVIEKEIFIKKIIDKILKFFKKNK